MLLCDVFRFCPERASHFLPFVSVDPGRMIQEQLESLRELEQEFPIFGLKISPVACQTNVIKLLGEGEILLEFAHERNWPILFHVTTDPREEFFGAENTFRVVERYPELRYSLAHALCFHRGYLDRAAALPNVWVDTAALKIMVQLIYANDPPILALSDRLESDYLDHLKVMQTLVQRYPKTIVWGSDTPYHSYITRRLQGDGYYYEFRLKGMYEKEKAALDILSPDARHQLGANALDFIFG